MTEAEWTVCDDPRVMLEFLRGDVSDRKERLFAVSCCRRIWHLLDDERCRIAIEMAERFADGLASDSEREVSAEAARAVAQEYGYVAACVDPHDQNYDPAFNASHHDAAAAADLATSSWRVVPNARRLAVRAAACSTAWDEDAYYAAAHDKPFPDTDNPHLKALRVEETAHANLLRDIFANPFRPITINPDWLTPSVVTLAQIIYDERAFDRLPALADAMIDAGCDNQDVLSHCRSEEPHVRGCWVVDLVLGKE